MRYVVIDALVWVCLLFYRFCPWPAFREVPLHLVAKVSAWYIKRNSKRRS